MTPRTAIRQRLAMALLERLPPASRSCVGYHADVTPGHWRVMLLWPVLPKVGSMRGFGRAAAVGESHQDADEALLGLVLAMPKIGEMS